MSGITGRHMIGEYLNITPKDENATWGVMGTGFTEANEEMNAQTDSKKYINNASATGSVKSYEWSKSVTADLIEDEDVISYMADIGRTMKTGGDCETEHVTVHMNKPVSGKDNTFYARKIGVSVAISSFSDNDGEMQMEGELLGRGDIVEGEFNTKSRTFTEKTAVSANPVE